MPQTKRLVMVFGTFDIIHPGHLNFFRQAKRYGNLIVVISKDKTVKELKGRYPLHNEKKRLRKVKDLHIASQVVLGSIDDKCELIKRIKPHVICLGYDQTFFTEKLRERLKELNLKISLVRLKPYKDERYKSSKLYKP